MSSNKSSSTMCLTIETGQLNFAGKNIKCTSCTDGSNYAYTEKCVACAGKGKTPKNGRNYRCKVCTGNGYVALAEKLNIGNCYACNGSTEKQVCVQDWVTKEDREWILTNLFNFEKPYKQRTSSFNEGYLGIGVIAGATDYGRYMELDAAGFKQMVQDQFMKQMLKYTCLLKENKLPVEILIIKKENGWFAYGIYS